MLADTLSREFFLYIPSGEDSFTGIVMGHEISGIVHALGKNIRSKTSDVQVGDKVAVFPWTGCNQCEICLEGFSNMCENNPSGFRCVGQGKATPGGYATFVPVKDINQVVKLPDSIPMDVGSMLPCSVLTAYQALTKCTASLERADTIRGRANLLLIGMGGLGLWAVRLVRFLFSEINVSVICADIGQEKLDLASEAGADLTVLWRKEDPAEELVKQTTNSYQDKIDSAIDFVGSDKTLSIAVNSLHNGGTVVPIGLAGGTFKGISAALLISRSICIHGHRTASLPVFKEVVQNLGKNAECLNYPKLEYYNLDEINDVLQKLKKGEINGRAIIKY